MTSTHDLPTVAGWWRGHDIEVRERCRLVRNGEAERSARKEDRKALWRALRAAGQVSGRIPAPQATSRMVDACVGFVARTPAQLALIPLEDALALEEQPNVPGTIDEHPNWRRRYATNAGEMLDDAEVRKRLDALARSRRA